MQGVNILNTTEILGNPSWAINLINVGSFIAIIGAIFMIVTMIIAHKFTYKTIKTMAVVSFLTIIVGLLVVIITSITSLQKRVPTGRCQYEATIDDTVSFTELNDQYEVIEQRGKIWILEDKEERRR